MQAAEPTTVGGFSDGPPASLRVSLRHMIAAWERAVAAVLRPFELTHVEFVLLASLCWSDAHGRASSLLELGERVATDVELTLDGVRKLEVKGLIDGIVDRADGERGLRPTPEGADRARRATVAVRQAEERFLDSEAEVLMPALRRLVGAQGGTDEAGAVRPTPGPSRELHGSSQRPPGVDAAKDLAAEDPHELDEELEGYAWIPRMLDKARATLAGTAGRYQFGCPVDHTCMARLGIAPELVLELAARYTDDSDVLNALRTHGIPPAEEAWFGGQEVEDELQETGNYLRVRAREALPNDNAQGGHVFAGGEHEAGVSVVLIEAAPGQAQEPHAHEVEEVVAINEGAATFFLGKQQARIVRAGEVVRIPAGVAHRWVAGPVGPLRAVAAYGAAEIATWPA